MKHKNGTAAEVRLMGWSTVVDSSFLELSEESKKSPTEQLLTTTFEGIAFNKLLRRFRTFAKDDIYAVMDIAYSAGDYLPLYLQPKAKHQSSIAVISYDKFIEMPMDALLAIHAKRHILVVGRPAGRDVKFDLKGFQQVGNLTATRSIHGMWRRDYETERLT